jgi:hypothetical protein
MTKTLRMVKINKLTNRELEILEWALGGAYQDEWCDKTIQQVMLNCDVDAEEAEDMIAAADWISNRPTPTNNRDYEIPHVLVDWIKGDCERSTYMDEDAIKYATGRMYREHLACYYGDVDIKKCQYSIRAARSLARKLELTSEIGPR